MAVNGAQDCSERECHWHIHAREGEGGHEIALQVGPAVLRVQTRKGSSERYLRGG